MRNYSKFFGSTRVIKIYFVAMNYFLINVKTEYKNNEFSIISYKKNKKILNEQIDNGFIYYKTIVSIIKSYIKIVKLYLLNFSSKEIVVRKENFIYNIELKQCDKSLLILCKQKHFKIKNIITSKKVGESFNISYLFLIPLLFYNSFVYSTGILSIINGYQVRTFADNKIVVKKYMSRKDYEIKLDVEKCSSFPFKFIHRYVCVNFIIVIKFIISKMVKKSKKLRMQYGGSLIYYAILKKIMFYFKILLWKYVKLSIASKKFLVERLFLHKSYPDSHLLSTHDILKSTFKIQNGNVVVLLCISNKTALCLVNTKKLINNNIKILCVNIINNINKTFSFRFDKYTTPSHNNLVILQSIRNSFIVGWKNSNVMLNRIVYKLSYILSYKGFYMLTNPLVCLKQIDDYLYNWKYFDQISMTPAVLI